MSTKISQLSDISVSAITLTDKFIIFDTDSTTTRNVSLADLRTIILSGFTGLTGITGGGDVLTTANNVFTSKQTLNISGAPGDGEFLRIKNIISSGSTTPQGDFTFDMQSNFDNPEWNTPVRWGWLNSTKTKSWFSMEPNYLGSWIEMHYEVKLPNNQDSRLMSSTFTSGNNMSGSTNTWHFRGDTFHIMNLESSPAFYFNTENGYLGLSKGTGGIEWQGTPSNIHLTKTGEGILGLDASLHLNGVGRMQIYSSIPNAEAGIIFMNNTGNVRGLGYASPAYPYYNLDNCFYISGAGGIELAITPDGNTIIGSATQSITTLNTGYKLRVIGSTRVENDLAVIGSSSVSGTLTAGRITTSHNTANSSIGVGTFELQSYSVNNGFLTDNLFYNGANWQYRSTGYGVIQYFLNGDYGIWTASSQAAGSDANSIMRERFTVKNNGQILLHAISEYADNAAAVTASLPVGTIYRTGDLLKIVH